MDTHEVKGKVKEWEGKAEQGYGQIKETLADTASDISSDYAANDTQVEIANAFEDAMDLVRRRPLEAVGATVLLGMGLGALLAFWSRD